MAATVEMLALLCRALRRLETPTLKHKRWLVGASLVWGVAACSPALNWRQVELGDLSLWLPCKPDRTQRDWQLPVGTFPVEVVGCEADGALFAASHLRGVPPDRLEAALDAWQGGAFASMAATQTSVAASVARGAAQQRQWSAQGHRATGEPVQARLAWWVVGQDIYHVAVYAKTLSAEQVDPLLEQIKLP